MKALKKLNRTWFIPSCLFLLLIGGYVYCLFAPCFQLEGKKYIYIDRDDNIDSVYHQLKQTGKASQLLGIRTFALLRGYGNNVRTGKYEITNQTNAWTMVAHLANGRQVPVQLTIGSVRTLDRLAKSISKQLMMDSTEVSTLTSDSNAYYLFIPNTYEVYWNISIEKLKSKMEKEQTKFWNSNRLEKAKQLELTPHEVSIMASIVEEETNNNQEKPMVAGLYYNRLKQGMLLQADPTVKFALKDFGIKRILHEHLTVDSPYNTYKYEGLPPAPIRLPSPQGIDAVLNLIKHDYIYMCAKEDFSGTHNFAATLSEHSKNARKYWKALNERKIFK